MSWEDEPRRVTLTWQATWVSALVSERFGKLRTALKRSQKLFFGGHIDLIAGGAVELAWPGVRLEADVWGTRQVEGPDGEVQDGNGGGSL
jgi:hypothetical protein